MIVLGIFVCSSFLISVCMFIVSKALLISSATMIVRAGGAIWLNPFAILNILVRNASPRWPMCFRCLIFSLSGTCELLVLFYWTGEVVRVMLYPVTMTCFVLLCQWICLFCVLHVCNCFVIQLAICLGVFVILLLNVMELVSVIGGALLDRPCMVFQRMCVLCLWSK